MLQINPKPTSYPALNEMLGILVNEIQSALGDNFVGAYLQGSFAVGDFTETSDVDITIAIKRDITGGEIPQFQELHKRLFQELPKPWGQRIELAYAPIDILRRWSEEPRDPPDFPRSDDWTDPSTQAPPKAYPFWYLDNGADTLVRSEHDNTRVVRWVTRERGIALAGPDPKTLIEPVTHKELASEVLDMLRIVDKDWAIAEKLNTRMLQTFFVTLCVRALHTLETGTVTSKKAATEWASAILDSKWKSLIEDSWTAWQGSRDHLSDKADPADSERTAVFIHYVLDRAEQNPVVTS